ELHLLAGRLIGAANREALRNEIANFIDFLERRALRRVGDVTVPSTYVGPMLRLGVQIVSISSRREEEGGDPKVWVDYAVKNYAQAGIRLHDRTHGNRRVLFMDENHGVPPGRAPSAAPGQANGPRRPPIRPLHGS